jgi:hypothetical protein
METPQTHCYAAGTVTLLWKCNMVHRSCYQGKPDMSQYRIQLREDLSYLNTIRLCISLFPNDSTVHVELCLNHTQLATR